MVEETESKTIYFKKPGKENTARTLELAKARADELGIKQIVVATTRGGTAVSAAEIFSGDFNLVAVTHSTGFRGPDIQQLEEDNRKKLEDAGVSILTTTHAFGGIGRAVRFKLETYQTEEIVAYALRTFGQGTKVGIEIAVMASDAGLIKTEMDAIVIGGTGKGADTALVVTPTHTQTFFDIKVHEIICKPW
jgi:hypothetical protein